MPLPILATTLALTALTVPAQILLLQYRKRERRKGRLELFDV